MPSQNIRGYEQISTGTVQRNNLNIDTPDRAVIRRAIAGQNIFITQTGVDSGTGDVTFQAILDGSTAVLGATVTLTGTAAAYQDTLFSITLPSSGTYAIHANIRGALTGNAGTLWWLTGKLVNTTESVDITNSERLIILTGVSGQVFQITCPIDWVVSVNGSRVISLHAFRNGSGSPSWTTSQILSDSNGRTTLSYEKLS